MDVNPTHDDKKPEESGNVPAPEGVVVGGIMDLKPPVKPGVTGPVPAGTPAVQSETVAQEPVAAPAPEAPSDVVTSSPSAPTPPAAPQAASRPGLSADLLARAKKEVENKSPDSPDPKSAHHKKKKGNVPTAAIVVAVLVALILSGAAVFAYLKTKDGQNKVPTVVNTTNEPAAATTEDVDEVTKEIDKVINETDADKDLPESELSEQTLGL